MDNQIKKTLTVLALFVALPSSPMSAPLWSDVATKQSATTLSAKQLNPHVNSRRVSVDLVQLKSVLASATPSATAPAQKSATATQLELPMPDGSQQIFNIVESSIMEPELAAKFPQIKTYKAVAANDATVSGRLDLGPNGFHGYLFTAKGEVFIDPVPASGQQEYYSAYKSDYASTQTKTFSCGVKAKLATASPLVGFKNAELVTAARTSGDIITYRIAIAATGEYSLAAAGGVPGSVSVGNTLAEITNAINRVTAIYERDLGIRFLLVGNNNLIIYTDAGTDPYDNFNPSALLTDNQTTLDSVLGTGAYDIGHVFSTGGGGLAALGVACNVSNKARGETGLTNPIIGDLFYIDFVAHEIGHQLGANHTFNGTTGNCGGGNRNATTAFEPGSGSTIMAYAGICSSENIASNSDATFHAGSIVEILAHTRTGSGNVCAGADAGSVAPAVAAGLDYNIPGGTAFTLNGSATDTEVLKYQWDQMDLGLATSLFTHGTDNGSNALFRSFLPVATGERTFPQMSTILSNLPDKAETLPMESRTLNFRLTARDGLGGVAEGDMQVIVDGTKGPFEVLQPNNPAVILDSSQLQSIQWNAACTEIAPVSCLNVDILYSIDDGLNFTTLVATTPNDGIADVNFANVVAANARIKIACSNNVFFDMSDVDFELQNGTGTVLSTVVIGGSGPCGTAASPIVTSDIEPNDSIAQAQDFIFPAAFNGTINRVSDRYDYFVFMANRSRYTITLSNYGGSDLDLYLLSGAGVEIAGSTSFSNPTEVIIDNLSAGQTYYIKIDGWDTSSLTSTYTLDVLETAIPPAPSGGGGVLSAYWLFMLLMTPLLRLKNRRVH